MPQNTIDNWNGLLNNLKSDVISGAGTGNWILDASIKVGAASAFASILMNGVRIMLKRYGTHVINNFDVERVQ